MLLRRRRCCHVFNERACCLWLCQRLYFQLFRLIKEVVLKSHTSLILLFCKVSFCLVKNVNFLFTCCLDVENMDTSLITDEWGVKCCHDPTLPNINLHHIALKMWQCFDHRTLLHQIYDRTNYKNFLSTRMMVMK